MEIEIVMRIEVNTPDFDRAQEAFKEYINNAPGMYLNSFGFRLHFNNFHFMAAQPIEDLHDYDEEPRKVGRPKKSRCINGEIEPCNCAMH